jgi:hypothetical protein
MKDMRFSPPMKSDVDVVEIMKKIRQNAALNRSELTMDEKVRREARSEFMSLVQGAQLPDFLVEDLRQKKVFEPYDPRTLYASSRPGVGSVIGLIRKILRPITKLFINLDPMAHELNRLSLLNNFYLVTIQDLIGKVASMRVETHHLRRSQHHRDGNQQRPNSQFRQHRRGGRSRRDNDPRNANPNPEPRSAPEEPQNS